METLIVVHTETEYLDPSQVGKSGAARTKDLFERISLEIARFEKNSFPVYFLASNAESPTSNLIYPTVKAHFPYMNFVSHKRIRKNENYCQQFLTLKEMLMDDIEPICLVGVSYYRSIDDLFHLMKGTDTISTPKEFYQIASRELGWSSVKFEKVFRRFFHDAFVNYKLTDKS